MNAPPENEVINNGAEGFEEEQWALLKTGEPLAPKARLANMPPRVGPLSLFDQTWPGPTTRRVWYVVLQSDQKKWVYGSLSSPMPS